MSKYMKKSFTYSNNNSRTFIGIKMKNNEDLTIWYGARIVEINEENLKKLEELSSYKTLVDKKALIVKDYKGNDKELKKLNDQILAQEQFKKDLGNELEILKSELSKKPTDDIKKEYEGYLTATDKKLTDQDKLINKIIEKIYNERMKENGYI